ncbi:hypothetical protein [Nesterenkonia muleiensis]|uniref:hypothetical protein n=1 Tax=Nesterenkonia muleiensis TaxID=2282648 RepID=UPI000E718FD7|nr:hypothetical protein [Nesterenkonia muleiensis]
MEGADPGPHTEQEQFDASIDTDALLRLEQFNPELGNGDVQELLDGSRTSEIVEHHTQSTYNSQIQNDIAKLHSRYGTPFAAFLNLEDIDLSGGGHSLAQQFHSCYLGSFNTYEELAQSHIRALGWQEEIDKLIRTEAIPPGFFTWDYKVVIKLITEAWDIVELDGWLHQFSK